ncbi:hypothetical protein DH2020_015639 [Rehmannia glutinosa]|uniref:Protein kinase domain-containing protein n=1 Tax=Rehmannia glutinosa TaxID=99300 RepID=A0ABR0WT82_REHGL
MAAAAAILFLVLTSAPLLTWAELNADTEAEIQALTSVKMSLHDPLGVLTGWEPSTPSAPCDWRGVGCFSGRVSELRLPHLQLVGELSPQIANLRMLRKINLRSNLLNGTIPSALFRCTLLHSIFLQYNLFTGNISAEISNLTNLLVFNVADNRISGEIPKVLPQTAAHQFVLQQDFGRDSRESRELQSLQYLWLDYNSLVGTLPSALANCSGLVHFSAEGNAIGGVLPAAIGGLPKLQVVSLSHNNLSGSVPGSLFCNVSDYPPSIRIVQLGFNAFTEIGSPLSVTCFSVMQVFDLQKNQIPGGFPLFLTNVSSLTSVDLSGNLFSGSLPSGIGSLQQLEELKLANNSFSGLVPTDIRNCRSLRILDLEGNLFSGIIPTFVIELINLKVLSLGGNNFSGPILTSFGNLTALESLNLRGNGLTGGLPEELMVLSNLSTLDLSGNKLNGSIPTSIGNLKQLTGLNLSGNGFSSSIPESIGSLFKLTSLDLSKQNMSGVLPSNLVGLPNLQVIALQENMFSGEVPEGLSSLFGLQYLNLSFNSFSGHISPTFGFLNSLVVLSLSNNHISGLIPPQLGNCSSLGVIDLRSNALSGQIPIEFSGLSHLKVLDLGRNNLTGQIPEKISNCSSLTSLSLDSNHLTGTIPANLSLISSLVNLNVSNNNLEGEIPVTVSSRFNNQSSFSGNQGLCGKPLDKKCEENGDDSGKNKLILFIAVAASGILLMLSCCCFYIYSFLRWREKVQKGVAGEKKQSPARASSRSSGGRGSSENGGPKLIITRHGVLFKACYNDGMVLAIRRLPNGSLDLNMFRKEAESLGRVKHRNLTVLRGYYAGSPDVRLLVYDYMPNGNLATLLQEASHQDGHVLNWPMRHLIALGIARGLAFLHAASMVHGDVKPQNVLFDADFEAHLSDFGLDKLTVAAPAEASTSASVGTLGYISPEATLTNEVTKESDVYSFGILLLELLTGKKPVMFTQDEDVVKWVKRQLQRGQISELLEPGLLELDPESSEWEEFLLGIKVGLLCTAPDPLDRPTMADIVFMLEGCRVGPDIPSSADPTLGGQCMPGGGLLVAVGGWEQKAKGEGPLESEKGASFGKVAVNSVDQAFSFSLSPKSAIIVEGDSVRDGNGMLNEQLL